MRMRRLDVATYLKISHVKASFVRHDDRVELREDVECLANEEVSVVFKRNKYEYIRRMKESYS